MKRVYLSGQMRGLPDGNLAEFRRVGQKLADEGFSVMNPAFTRHGETGSRTDYIREDALMLLVSDEVVVLENWIHSPGARWEVATAWSFGIPVYVVREAQVLVGKHQLTDELTFTPLLDTSVVIPRETQFTEGRPLLGLCGYARAGKDTFALALSNLGWQRVAFADPLKQIARACGWDGQKDEVGRNFLQNLGVGVRDHLDSDAWVRAGEEAIDRAESPVVITDVRFPNEVAMVKRRAGTLVWIQRPGVEAVNSHISEHAVGPYDCDLTFLNEQPLFAVQAAVEIFMESNGFLKTSVLASN